MEPACSIIAKLGGDSEVARITGRKITSPWRWKREIDRDGTGGVIPPRHIPALLAAAKEKGVALCYEDFYPNALEGASKQKEPA